MRCLVCDSNDWENVDKYRLLEKHDGKPVGMAICNKCGFVSYPEKYKTEDEIKEYYRKEYRGGAPTFGNIVTGKRKLNHHNTFLKEVFMKWQDDGNTAPVIGECGSAIGMVLSWFKKKIPNCEVHGTELTTLYRNTAYHEYGIDLKEDFDLTRKYDLIMTYKVAEHMVDVDLRIREYAEALKEGGYLYISVPTWFNSLENSGVGGFDLEYYYHPDHINVWTRILFEEVLRKCGLKVVKIDRIIYGDSYLCKRDDSVMKDEPRYEKPEEIKGAMARIKKAHDFMLTQKSEPAIEQWGNFPVAWGCQYEKTRQDLDKRFKGNGIQIAEFFCGEMRKACGETSHELKMRADILMRYGHYVEAIEVLEYTLSLLTADIHSLYALARCFRSISEIEQDPVKKARLLLTSRDICRKVMTIDSTQQGEAYNWALRDQSAIEPKVLDEIIRLDSVKEKETKATPAVV